MGAHKGKRKRPRKTNEQRKKVQAIKSGLLVRTGHKSHVSGKRFIREWSRRQHRYELRKIEGNFLAALHKE